VVWVAALAARGREGNVGKGLVVDAHPGAQGSEERTVGHLSEDRRLAEHSRNGRKHSHKGRCGRMYGVLHGIRTLHQSNCTTAWPLPSYTSAVGPWTLGLTSVQRGLAVPSP
jgi:hypothetical protein